MGDDVPVSILDMIDNAIWDHRASHDAMRWTPPAPRLDMTGFVRAVEPVAAAFASLVAAFRGAQLGLGAFTEASTAPVPAGRSRRLSRMHATYRRRRR